MAGGSLHLPSPPGNRSALAAAAKGSLNCDSTWHSAGLLNIAIIHLEINHFDFFFYNFHWNIKSLYTESVQFLIYFFQLEIVKLCFHWKFYFYSELIFNQFLYYN